MVFSAETFFSLDSLTGYTFIGTTLELTGSVSQLSKVEVALWWTGESFSSTGRPGLSSWKKNKTTLNSARILKRPSYCFLAGNFGKPLFGATSRTGPQ